MSEQKQRQQPQEKRNDQDEHSLTEMAPAAGGGDKRQKGQDIPPAGDVRTVYANDRDPGEAEPDQPGK
jgi:hypothetical protein